MRRVLPRVVEDKYVIGADAQHNEDRENVEDAEVAKIEDDAIDEIGTEETGHDAEHGPAGHPEGARLNEQEQHDEHDTAEHERQVPVHERLDSVEEQRHTAVEERHVPYASFEILLPDRFEVVDCELPDVRELILRTVRGVLVTLEGHAEGDAPTYDGRLRVGRVDGRIFAEREVETDHCARVQHSSV